MLNRWSEEDAARAVDLYGPAWGEAVALRTYASRLLGCEPALVLHGGGNASVKAPWRNVAGDDVPAIFVKASGFDMATIEPGGHPAMDLGALLRLRRLEALDDAAMVNEVRRALFDARSPTPSIETLVHAFLPGAYGRVANGRARADEARAHDVGPVRARVVCASRRTGDAGRRLRSRTGAAGRHGHRYHRGRFNFVESPGRGRPRPARATRTPDR
jgi:hypothetical protein